MKAYLGTATVLAAMLIIFTLGREAQSQRAEDARVAQILDIMEGINKSQMGRLQSVMQRGAPDSDEGWRTLEISGALLNEVGHMIVQSGRSRDSVWEEASASLRAAGADLLEAAKAKDEDALRSAIQAVGRSCKTCHDVHREE